MRAFVLIGALAGLAACEGQEKRTTYSCPNGPDLTVIYRDASATLIFPDGRSETLPQADPDNPNLYAKPGTVWNVVSFRNGELTDGQQFYNCDQMVG